MIKATVIIVPYAYCSYVNPKLKLLKIILPLYIVCDSRARLVNPHINNLKIEPNKSISKLKGGFRRNQLNFNVI